MEKIFSNNRLLVIAFFTAFSTGMVPMASAGENNQRVPVELRLTRWINSQPLFEFGFAGNPQNNEFTIIIRDEAGTQLYRENIIGENFTKSFLLNTQEISNDTLSFEIISKRSNEWIAFPISRFTFLEDEKAIG